MYKYLNKIINCFKKTKYKSKILLIVNDTTRIAHFKIKLEGYLNGCHRDDCKYNKEKRK